MDLDTLMYKNTIDGLRADLMEARQEANDFAFKLGAAEAQIARLERAVNRAEEQLATLRARAESATPDKHLDKERLALFTWDGENHASLPANAYYQVTSGLLRFPMPVGNGSISVGMSLVLLDGKVVAIDAARKQGGAHD